MRERGMSLVELMVCLALALALSLAAIAAVISARASLDDQDESARLVETGLLAQTAIARALRQAGYENWGAAGAAWENQPGLSPSVFGLDDARLPDDQPALDAAASPGINHSDVLALRFFGSGTGAGDGSMLNCAGVAVPEPATGDAEEGRGWSIFHVARTGTAEPELRCKYRAQNGKTWDSQALASGVESLQVLFGFDGNGDGVPERYLPAGAIGKNQVGSPAWREVAALRVALLVRSTADFGMVSGDGVYDLFGAEYAQRQGQQDPGAQVWAASLPKGERQRLRRVFSMTIALPNRAAVKTAEAL